MPKSVKLSWRVLGKRPKCLPYSRHSSRLGMAASVTNACIAWAAEPPLLGKRLTTVCHCVHAGFERDRVLESIARTKVEHRSRPREVQIQDPYLQMLLQMDAGHEAFTMMTQHLSSAPIFAYTPQHKDICPMPEQFGNMLKGKHEIISDIQDTLRFP